MVKKNPNAVRLAQLRMVKMTPEERREVAATGGKARAQQTTGTTLAESGKKGGAARAAKLTRQQRSAIAKKGAVARWKKKNED